MSTIYTFDTLRTIPMSVCGIYRITCTVNGKQYIGSSKDIQQRLRQHKYNAGGNNTSIPLLYTDMRLYGLEFFNIEILEQCSEHNLLGREDYWIKMLNTNITGYNMHRKTDLTGKKHGESSFLLHLEVYNLYGYAMHKMPQHICGIYCITSLDTGKQYVGRSADLKVRLRSHRYDSVNHPDKSPILYSDINVYGIERFKVELLEECSQDDLISREHYWLDVLGTEYDGYNRHFADFRHTDETRQRFSQVRKGRVFSEEHRKKLSQGRAGKKHSDAAKKVMREAKIKQSKFSVDDVRDIKRLLKEGVKHREIMDRYNISRGTVYRIKFGLLWGGVQVDE